MKHLLFCFLLISNTIFAQDNSIVSANKLLNLGGNSDISIAIANIDSRYHLNSKKTIELENGISILKIVYNESDKSDELISDELHLIDSLNYVLLEVFGDEHEIENKTIVKDTLYFNLSEDYGICDVFAFDEESHVYSYLLLPNSEKYLVLPHGTYYFMARYMVPDINHVFKNDYEFNEKDTISFNVDDAIYEVDLRPVDINGDTLPNTSDLMDEICYMYQFPLGYFAGIRLSASASLNMKFYFSNNQDNIEINFYNNYCKQPGENELHFIDYMSLTQIDKDTILSNNANDYVSSNIKFKLSNQNNSQLNHYFSHESGVKYFNSSGNYRISYPMIILYKKTKNNSYWKGKIHFSKYGNPNFSICSTCYILSDLNDDDVGINFKTNLYDIIDDSISNYLTFSPNEDNVTVPENDTLYAGMGASLPWLRIRDFYAEVSVQGSWHGSAGEKMYPVDNSQLFEILDENGNVVYAGSGCEFYSLIEPGITSIKFTNSHNEFDNFNGVSEGVFSFNTTLSDYRPPTIRPFQFRDENNIIRHNFNPDNDIDLYFAAADFYDYDLQHNGHKFHQVNQGKTLVKIKEHQQSEWQVVDVNSIYQDSLIGDLFKADLSKFISNDSSLYDIQIKVVDSAGNSATYSLYPAFAVADFNVGVKPNIKNQLRDLFQIYPNPVENTLNIKLLENKETVNIKVFNALGMIIYDFDIREKEKSINLSGFANGMYYISVNDGINTSTKKFIKK
ncbi:MAG: T9SS type A sorting domain-containing protein [Chlorobi bacterium]|nr:T9SS type A sorting domain-containing protein [Chlorobiota bacterium]